MIPAASVQSGTVLSDIVTKAGEASSAAADPHSWCTEACLSAPGHDRFAGAHVFHCILQLVWRLHQPDALALHHQG